MIAIECAAGSTCRGFDWSGLLVSLVHQDRTSIIGTIADVLLDIPPPLMGVLVQGV
jgi:hypothetical protein